MITGVARSEASTSRAARGGGALARELSSARTRLAAQTRQIQELNDRAANSLLLAVDMLTFEQLRACDPQAVAALEASRARLVAVGELHRYLYDHADLPTVDLKPFLTGLSRAIADSTSLNCVADIESIAVRGEMAQQLAIAVNELAINAAKHAYPGRAGGLLEIKVRREGGDLTLTVADAGKGLDDADRVGQGRRGGLGMAILAAIVRDLRGDLSMRNAAGAVFTLRAPLPAPSARSFQHWGD